MDAVTYPDEDVVRFLNEQTVCYKPRIDENEALAARFGVQWTPGLVWLTPEGKPCHENVGFFDPDEFLAESTFALGAAAVQEGAWHRALEHFESIPQRWSGSFAAPAAMYWSGVAAKMSSGEVRPLLSRWRQLLSAHPKSAWAMKAGFIESSGSSAPSPG